MGRPTKKSQFLKMLFQDIEQEPTWELYRIPLYKEYIQHINQGTPRWLYDHLYHLAEEYWDYMTTEVDPHLQPEELVTDMGDVLDTPITRKLIEGLTGEKVLYL